MTDGGVMMRSKNTVNTPTNTDGASLGIGPNEKFGGSFPKIFPLPGSLHLEWPRCGKLNCRCMQRNPHRPDFYRYRYQDSRRHNSYLRRDHAEEIVTGVATWRQRQMRDKTPVIPMPFRRIRRLDLQAPGTVHANTPIQRLAADGFKAALAHLWTTRHCCPSPAPILAVHDELVIECDANEADAVAVWVTECLQAGIRHYLTRVSIRVEVSIACDWSGTPVFDGTTSAHVSESEESRSLWSGGQP
jgi:hypothetical protein